MHLIEEIFQSIANLLHKMAQRLRLNHVFQYRLLIASRATVALMIPIIGIMATIYYGTFNLEPDVITVLALGGSCAFIFYFVAMQYKIAFSSKTELINILDTKTIEELDNKDYLIKRRNHMIDWLLIVALMTSGIWLTSIKLKLLYAALIIPALVDTSLVIVIVSWEISRTLHLTEQKLSDLPTE